MPKAPRRFVPIRHIPDFRAEERRAAAAEAAARAAERETAKAARQVARAEEKRAADLARLGSELHPVVRSYTTVAIDRDLHRELKLAALQADLPFGVFVDRVHRAGLAALATPPKRGPSLR